MNHLVALIHSGDLPRGLWEANENSLQKIRPFISAVDLTIPSGPSKDLQIHDHGAAEVYGRITIPILSQNATFSENSKNWTAFQAFAPTLQEFICMASLSSKEHLKTNHPRPQGRAKNDYEAALEICQRPLPAGQTAMPFSDEMRSVNCFSHVRISVNISMGNPWEKLAPDTDTRACGPWVVIVPWGKWHVFGDWFYGGRMTTPNGINRELMPSDYLNLRKEEYVHNTPFAPIPGNERYQFEYFMPHIPEHNGEMFEEMAEIAKEKERECPEMMDPEFAKRARK